MTAPGMHPRKSGPKPAFSLEDVINAAIDLGVAEFSITSVARVLGVKPPSVYRVVESRDDLLMLCFKRAASTMVLPDSSLNWVEMIRWYHQQLWKVTGEFPGIARAILASPGSHVVFQDYLLEFSRKMKASGMPHNEKAVYFGIDLIGKIVLVSRLVQETASDKRAMDKATQQLAKLATSPEQTVPTLDPAKNEEMMNEQIEFVISGLKAMTGDK
ncbi:TetR/AcrR family transcriptional regulator [Corynebacterium mendelii]|uniref:TetR/AcrR family transcriptional regulator n=1 Tax=Corynebacterium mendelii TaxID=2765362 RepID=A0A939E2Y9_9CORY|nr:TetR/AcrR family transcriptional regulator [Corynebacterium mendelii]MBN9644731.1 TetR/AcrR family transcriptional regulator [Corynebacterium mendelii]